jgi:hypothetical protein
MNYKSKSNLDVIMVIILGLIIIIGIIGEINKGTLIPTILIIHVNNIEDLMNTLFSVHASIVTLGTALIALLSEATKERIYGITVSKFIMHIKPRIFKHKTIIVLQLCLIFIGYISLSLKYYNLLVSIFIVSILLIILMVFDIFTIFYGNENIVKDIKDYYIEVFSLKKTRTSIKREQIYKHIRKDIEEAIQSKDNITILDHLQLMSEILSVIVKIRSDEMLKEFESEMVDILILILENNDRNFILTAISTVKDCYRQCNEVQVPFDIFDGCFEQIMNGIANLSYRDITQKIELYTLHKLLYQNVEIEITENGILQKNNSYLNIFTGRLYYLLKKNSLPDEDLNKLKVELYKEFGYLLNYTNKLESKRGLIYDELLKYTKALVDQREKYVLDKTYFNEMFNYYKNSDIDEIMYTLTILVYLYYLACAEELVESGVKEFVIKLLKENKMMVSEFLWKQHSHIITKEFEKYANDKLRMWEIMPEEEAKSIIMDYAIQDFILLNCIALDTNRERLKEILKPLVNEREFSIYSGYVGERKNNTKRKYMLFIELFMDIDEAEALISNKIDILEECFAQLYKEQIIIKRSQEKISEADIKDLEKEFGKYLTKTVKAKINMFNNNAYEITRKKQVILNITTDIHFLTTKILEEQFFEYIYTKNVTQLIDLLKKGLIIEEMKYSDKSALSIFFGNIEKNSLEVNTLVGYRNNYYGDNNQNTFADFEKQCYQIKSSGNNNILVAVNSKKVYFEINSINVKIIDMAMDEFADIKQDDKGNYLYNVTNDIYLPFLEAELIEYIHDTKRKVVFELDYSFGIDEGYIGTALFFKKEL